MRCEKVHEVGNLSLYLVPTLGQVEVSAGCYGCCARSASHLWENCIQDHFSSAFPPLLDTEWEPQTDRHCPQELLHSLAGRGYPAVWFYFNVNHNRNYLSIATRSRARSPEAPSWVGRLRMSDFSTHLALTLWSNILPAAGFEPLLLDPCTAQPKRHVPAFSCTKPYWGFVGIFLCNFFTVCTQHKNLQLDTF